MATCHEQKTFFVFQQALSGEDPRPSCTPQLPPAALQGRVPLIRLPPPPTKLDVGNQGPRAHKPSSSSSYYMYSKTRDHVHYIENLCVGTGRPGPMSSSFSHPVGSILCQHNRRLHATFKQSMLRRLPPKASGMLTTTPPHYAFIFLTRHLLSLGPECSHFSECNLHTLGHMAQHS